MTQKFQLFGGPISPFVRKVTIVLHEKNIQNLVLPVRSPTAIVKPNTELMTINPLSKIPTLISDDGTTVYESDVICDYLDWRFPETPIFLDRQTCWTMKRWNALASGALDALIIWRFERLREPNLQNPSVLTAYNLKLARTIERLEKDLNELKAMPFNLAHVSLGCLLGYLDFRFADIDWRDRAPQLRDWYNEFQQRPSAQKTVPFIDEAPADNFWP